MKKILIILMLILLNTNAVLAETPCEKLKAEINSLEMNFQLAADQIKQLEEALKTAEDYKKTLYDQIRDIQFEANNPTLWAIVKALYDAQVIVVDEFKREITSLTFQLTLLDIQRKNLDKDWEANGCTAELGRPDDERVLDKEPGPPVSQTGSGSQNEPSESEDEGSTETEDTSSEYGDGY